MVNNIKINSDNEKNNPELYDIKNVLSYKETGIRASWNRDNSVQRIFNSKNINWIQFDKQGVKRGIKSRDGWDKNWYYYVNQEIKQTKRQSDI